MARGGKNNHTAPPPIPESELLRTVTQVLERIVGKDGIRIPEFANIHHELTDWAVLFLRRRGSNGKTGLEVLSELSCRHGIPPNTVVGSLSLWKIIDLRLKATKGIKAVESQLWTKRGKERISARLQDCATLVTALRPAMVIIPTLELLFPRQSRAINTSFDEKMLPKVTDFLRLLSKMIDKLPAKKPKITALKMGDRTIALNSLFKTLSGKSLDRFVGEILYRAFPERRKKEAVADDMGVRTKKARRRFIDAL